MFKLGFIIGVIVALVYTMCLKVYEIIKINRFNKKHHTNLKNATDVVAYLGSIKDPDVDDWLNHIVWIIKRYFFGIILFIVVIVIFGIIDYLNY